MFPDKIVCCQKAQGCFTSFVTIIILKKNHGDFSICFLFSKAQISLRLCCGVLTIFVTIIARGCKGVPMTFGDSYYNTHGDSLSFKGNCHKPCYQAVLGECCDNRFCSKAGQNLHVFDGNGGLEARKNMRCRVFLRACNPLLARVCANSGLKAWKKHAISHIFFQASNPLFASCTCKF